MKLAKISDTNEEFKNFRSIAANSSDTLSSFFFDIDVSYAGSSSPKCSFFNRSGVNNPIQKIECDAAKKDFLCEAIEGGEKISTFKSQTDSAVLKKFFNYFGDFCE